MLRAEGRRPRNNFCYGVFDGLPVDLQDLRTQFDACFCCGSVLGNEVDEHAPVVQFADGNAQPAGGCLEEGVVIDRTEHVPVRD